MGVHVETWENAILTRAYEAFNTPVCNDIATAEQRLCREAYAYCSRLTQSNSRTFYLASGLLPKSKREAVRALYAFCRATDDLVDLTPHAADAHVLLENWRLRLGRHANAYDPVPLAWADTKVRYRIPYGYEAQLIEGIARDLHQTRYPTFAELADYCYGVASTVGLMVMHIVEFQSPAALRYAVKLGIALQLTNILRDIRADWQVGRLYLPLDELTAFGLTESDIAAGCTDGRWRAFMRFQVARARALYEEAEPGISLLGQDGRFAIAAASGLYQSILDDIEAHDYDVFRRRAHIGNWGKIRRLPRLWWRAQAPGRFAGENDVRTDMLQDRQESR